MKRTRVQLVGTLAGVMLVSVANSGCASPEVAPKFTCTPRIALDVPMSTTDSLVYVERVEVCGALRTAVTAVKVFLGRGMAPVDSIRIARFDIPVVSIDPGTPFFTGARHSWYRFEFFLRGEPPRLEAHFDRATREVTFSQE